ncbi:hypothetical protein [Candidatus Lucifugimonas marina]|uniref:Uncharacterized protein n=1 Tax=Candidatus Lucifugimonas marina TaxID=3038979 RepID=A0AAJ5ZGF8_9CHLR|nr:hypothetical protein [SAR202 cluster bacterium JH702]MDG0868300.1 hypothetical protein [SAR202 cluster bacterium JH639]WFG34944.1 hypothetical protein GKN94_04320 [SAR202 cluster bacterium JH545]WFG38895.1 hypothetical protein GKO48_04455 [SAR202 cluster bacterium JH1073]
MTSRANYNSAQSFDNDDGIEEEVEQSSAKQVLALVDLAAWHLRRVRVFVPVFGVIFLAIGFMWLQSVREESSLKLQSDQLNILLDQPAPQPELLLQQADGWGTAYEVVLGSRVARPQDSDLIERVITAASDSGLIIVETGTTLDGEAILENESYTATPVLINAIGTLEGIESYLAMLETSEFAAFGIEASSIEEGLVGYQLTLRGLYYSLPENFGETEQEGDAVIAVTPVVPVDAVGNGAAK